jgi:hypothetical protein
MNKVEYWAKRLALGLLGPAELDKEHDPREALDREQGEEKQS